MCCALCLIQIISKGMSRAISHQRAKFGRRLLAYRHFSNTPDIGKVTAKSFLLEYRCYGCIFQIFCKGQKCHGNSWLNCTLSFKKQSSRQLPRAVTIALTFVPFLSFGVCFNGCYLFRFLRILSYHGQLELGDNSRPAAIRTCVQAGCSQNLHEFLKELGFV